MIAVSAVLMLLLTDFVYRRVVSERISRLIDNVPPFGVVQQSETADAEELQIPASGGESIAALVFRPRQTAQGIVVFCPELGGDRRTAMVYSEGLVKSGFVVLAFDFSHNQPQPDELSVHWITNAQIQDLQNVIRFVCSHAEFGTLPLGLFGISRGGSAALITASRDERVRCVATDSAYTTRILIDHFIQRFSRHVVPEWFFRWLPGWHVRLVMEQALKRSDRRHPIPFAHLEPTIAGLTQPVLLISGRRDSYVTPEVTRRLAAVLVNSASTIIWIVDGARHNRARTIAQSDYDAKLIAHFQAGLQNAESQRHADSV
ncbi:MAG: hypothetical protein R3C49_14210 [Planctomycetaceae bacterium]